jgi:YesN/AraC family two-component response regulator
MGDKRKILYVDDEEINLKLFEISLRKEFDVITALSAFEGLEIMKNNSCIDVVASDLKMPVMNGLDFIAQIKKDNSEAICILLTGYEESEILMDGFNKDYIFRYLLKPWNKEKLIATMKEAIEQIPN